VHCGIYTIFFFCKIQQKTLIKMYANADIARPYYANADFATAKNAKKILHKHEKQRKNTRGHAHAQRTSSMMKNGQK
jgi:hypothetical protein